MSCNYGIRVQSYYFFVKTERNKCYYFVKTERNNGAVFVKTERNTS